MKIGANNLRNTEHMKIDDKIDQRLRRQKQKENRKYITVKNELQNKSFVLLLGGLFVLNFSEFVLFVVSSFFGGGSPPNPRCFQWGCKERNAEIAPKMVTSQKRGLKTRPSQQSGLVYQNWHVLEGPILDTEIHII